jgi:hypothetical protein
MGVLGFALAPSKGQVLLSMSPNEFLIPFALQIIMVVVTALPVAWLISRRSSKPLMPTDVFD